MPQKSVFVTAFLYSGYEITDYRRFTDMVILNIHFAMSDLSE
jgi:hypothetical protein